MSSVDNLCRLCAVVCNDYILIYDEDGYHNEAYEITANYFHPELLDLAQGNNLKAMCMECWHHIYEFHKFRQFVIGVQTELIEKFKQMEATKKLALEHHKVISPNMSSNGEFKSAEHTKVLDESQNLLPSSLNAELIENLKKIKEENPPIETHVISDDSDSDDYDCDTDPMLEEFEEPVGVFAGEDFNDEAYDISFSELEDSYGETSSYEKNEVLHEYRNSKAVKNDDLKVNNDSLSLLKVPHTNDKEKIDDSKTNNIAKASVKHRKQTNNSLQYEGGSKRRTLQESDDLIAQWLPNLDCVACKQQFSTFTSLKLHFSECHPRSKFYILCCQRKYAYRCLVEEHVSLHLNPDTYRCQLCGKRFSSRANLCSHRHAHCSPSDKTRERKTFKELDEMIAKWTPYLSCVVCNAPYENFKSLQQHFRKKHAKKEFYVICCQRKFPYRFQLEEHIRVHLDPEAFKCENCDRCFSKKYDLATHRNSKCRRKSNLRK